jgi:hypothetical protein
VPLLASLSFAVTRVKLTRPPMSMSRMPWLTLRLKVASATATPAIAAVPPKFWASKPASPLLLALVELLTTRSVVTKPSPLSSRPSSPLPRPAAPNPPPSTVVVPVRLMACTPSSVLEFAVTLVSVTLLEKLPAPVLSSIPFAPLPEKLDDEMSAVVPPSPTTKPSPLLELALMPLMVSVPPTLAMSMPSPPVFEE